jgi:quinol monooxygenase YgiN
MRLFAAALLGLATMPIASAQAQDTNAYIVTYIEVAPAAKDQAATLVRELAGASRKEAGAMRFEILQRIDRAHHFAILEVWKDQGAQAAHAATPHSATSCRESRAPPTTSVRTPAWRRRRCRMRPRRKARSTP